MTTQGLHSDNVSTLRKTEPHGIRVNHVNVQNYLYNNKQFEVFLIPMLV